MNRATLFAACLLPLAASAATRSYETPGFEAVSVGSGVDVEIILGDKRSVVAESWLGDFSNLRIVVEGNVLKIDRPKWSFFGWTGYTVRVVTPVLRSIIASAGSDVTAKGATAGDFTIAASSGSDVHLTGIRGGGVRVTASSGSDIALAGTCSSLNVEASSGSDVKASDLRCETVVVRASSGSDLSVSASRSVAGKLSSGSDLTVHGAPASVQVDSSSGADVRVVN